jgi:hypothetical protein
MSRKLQFNNLAVRFRQPPVEAFTKTEFGQSGIHEPPALCDDGRRESHHLTVVGQ